jgi:hypothetical protein
MATSLKAVSRSRKTTVRKSLKAPSIDRQFRTALTHGRYLDEKWGELQDRAWADNDGMACLVAVEKGTMERGAKALDKLSWERLTALRQSLVQRPAVDVEDLMLSDLDDTDPEVVVAAAALKTLTAYMAERFPEREKALQGLRHSEW